MEYHATCKKCSARFKSAYSVHKIPHAAASKTPYKHKCPSCPKAFRTQEALQQHHQSSCNSKIFRCGAHNCEARFTTIYGIQDHCRTTCQPSNDALDTFVSRMWKPLQCTKCGKICATEKELKDCRELHSQFREFPCGQCSMIFSTQSERSEHLLRDEHFNRNCSECGAIFIEQNAFYMHEFDHKNGTQDYVGNIVRTV